VPPLNPPRPRHVAREAWYGLFTQALDKVVPVAIILYLARTLAPEQFGVYSFLVAYLAFFQIAAEQSLDTVLVRMASQQPGRRFELFHAALGLRLLAAVLAAFTVVALGGSISGGQVSVGLLVLASASLVTALGGAYRAVFRADLNIRAVFAIALGRAVFLMTAVVAAISFFPGLESLLAAIAAANLVAFVAVAFVVRGDVPFGVSADRELWAALARGAWPLAINAFAITVSVRAGQVLLMSMRGPVEVGLLGAASRVVEAFTVLPEALMITVYPLLAGLHGTNPARLIETAEKSVRYLVIATGVPVIACAVAGTEIMGLLFGEPFAEAGSVLAVLSVMALFSATGTVILNVLVAVHRETVLYRTTLVFAGVTVVACFPLIGAYGYSGAAVAMVFASVGSQVGLAVLPSTREYVMPCLGAAARSIVAVAAGVAAAKLAGVAAITEFGIATAVYVVGLVVLGVLNREEVRFARSMLDALIGQRREAGA
jgi:O-antigen/teichoic acid export membrane protein